MLNPELAQLRAGAVFLPLRNVDIKAVELHVGQGARTITVLHADDEDEKELVVLAALESLKKRWNWSCCW